jgi:hypothetical protein
MLELIVASQEDFRRRLAGLVDPDHTLAEEDQTLFRDLATEVVVLLCRHFGQELDRKTLWARIDSGLLAACSKVSDGDLDRWLDTLLAHVLASPEEAATCSQLAALRARLAALDVHRRMALVRYLESRRYAVLAYGRAAWESHKTPRNQVADS